MTLSGRLELRFGGIDCEFGGLLPPFATSFEQRNKFFSIPGLVGLMFFTSDQQSNAQTCETVCNT